MNNIQKTIKYLSIAFAILLIVSIFSGIIGAFNIVGDIFYREDKNIESKEIVRHSSSTYLSIDLKTAKLNIINGDKLSVETNNKYINVKEEKNKLIIKERDHFALNNKNIKVTITVPEDFYFDYVNIDVGAGSANIEELNSKILNFDFDAGKVKINKLIVLDKADIDNGAGKLDIMSSNINNLDLDLGVGKVLINSKLTGKNDIDCGVGKFDLNLSDSLNNYSFEISKGLGSMKINNKELHDDEKYGDGINSILINGGVGAVDITTK